MKKHEICEELGDMGPQTKILEVVTRHAALI